MGDIQPAAIAIGQQHEVEITQQELFTPVSKIRFDVLTLFPEMFHSYTGQSLLKLAIQAGLVNIKLWNFRDWANGKRKQVDDPDRKSVV